MKRKSIELVALSAAIAAAPIIANKQVVNTKKTTKIKSEIHNTSVNNTNVSLNNENTNAEKIIDSGKYIYLSQQTNVYDKKIELLNEAIKIDPLNITAWYSKIDVMESNSSNTIKEYKNLTNQMIKVFSDSPIKLFALAIQIKGEFLANGSQSDYNNFVEEIKNTLENVKDPNKIEAAKYAISLMSMYDLVESKSPSVLNNKGNNTIDNKNKDNGSSATINSKNDINNNINNDDATKNSGGVLIKIIDPITGKPWANKIVHVYEQYINTQQENNISFMVMPIEEKTYETNSSGEIAIYNLSPGTVQFTIDYGNGQQMKKTVAVQAGKINNQEVILNNSSVNNPSVSNSNASNNIANTNINDNNIINGEGLAVISEKNLVNGTPIQANQYGQVNSANNDKKNIIRENSYTSKGVEINSNNNSNSSNNSNGKISTLPDTGINSVIKGFMIEILVWISILGTLGFALNIAKHKKHINKAKKLK